jgi:catechol 2,3-dioxygenase-like lactoylglutathione lyase family enzyme
VLTRRAAATGRSGGHVISKLSHVNLWVLNKDEAVAFYRDTLGFEVRQDMTLDGFRWVEVGPKGQPDVAFTLNEPGAPMMDEESAAAIRTLLEKGAMSGGVFQTDDCRATFAELSAKGVTFLQEPAERPYGVEALFRDNSGNWFSLTEPSGWSS